MSSFDRIALLEELLKHPPSTRHQTFLDGLDMTRTEQPHSLFLAWLLGSHGPLTDGWLLKTLFHLAVPKKPWPGKPHRVLPEAELESERPDILCEWESFKLIVEYKVDSFEGKEQASRYLKTFAITSPESGILNYVTPSGTWPGSVKRGDPRVLTLSYRRLIDCIDRALSSGAEPNERGRVFVCEYRDCLKRVLNRPLEIEMQKMPFVSDATKLISENYKHFNLLIELARTEALQFNWQLIHGAEKELRSILGEDMEFSSWERYGSALFRRPSWKTTECEYGFAFSFEGGQAGSLLMPEYEYYVYVGIWPLDHNAEPKSQSVISDALRKTILPRIPIKDDGHNFESAFYHRLKFDPADDWDVWANESISKLYNVAKALSPTLDIFAENYVSP